MGFADSRRQELRDAIEKYAPPLTAEIETKALLPAAIEWGDARSEHLDALCRILREQDGTSSAEAWKHRTDEMRSDLAKFAEALRSVSNPSDWARNYVQSNTAADEKFVAAVERARVAAEARDYMVGYLKTLREETENLETKWQKVVSEHGTYQQQEAAVIEQVERLIRDAAAQAQDLDAKMRQLIGDAVAKAKQALDPLPTSGADAAGIPGDDVIQVAGLGIETFRALAAGIEDQRMRFESYFRQETGSVLFLFHDFRETTKNFIDNYGYAKVQEQEEKANTALGDIASSGGTSSANRSDADQFTEAARILVKGHANNAKNTWDAFVQKHEHKFFGPVGPDLAKALLDRDLFSQKYERLQADNLNRLAEMWRSNAREVWGVDFSGLPPTRADAYKNALRDKLRDLDSLLRDPLLKRFSDSMTTVMENAASTIRNG